MSFFGQQHFHQTAGDGKVFFLIFAKFQLNLRFDWQHDSGGCCVGIREILSQKIFRFFNIWKCMNIVLFAHPPNLVVLNGGTNPGNNWSSRFMKPACPAFRFGALL